MEAPTCVPAHARHFKKQECVSIRATIVKELSKLSEVLTSMVRMGSWIMGPLPAEMSKGMFIPVSGVRMSEKRMTPSGWNARQGCNEISTCTHMGRSLLPALLVLLLQGRQPVA